MGKASFSLALLQMRIGALPSENLVHAERLLREAARRGATIACLPELFLSPYFCQTYDHALFDLAEPVPGPTTEALGNIARDTGMVIVGSLFERRAAGIYHNTAVVLDADGRYLGCYRKMHIPDDPLYYEKFYFTPGDLGYRAFSTKATSVGTLVCWDQWYPEAARATALLGAELLVYPTAIGWHPSEKDEYGVAQVESWETIQRSHAIANGLFVAAVNRVGHEGDPKGGIEFWGRSFVADPQGRILARAGSVDEEILIADCDPALIEVTRRHWPFLRDRRIDSFQPLTQRWGASVGNA